MALFQTSVLKKHIHQQDKELVAKAFKKFTKYFHDLKIQENIRSSKEEEYQGIFLTELFSKVLGYTMKPNANFNLVAEYKNEKNSKKADGAILKDNQAIGVIELKGTKTKDLEKVRQQAFDYKANQTGCVYVITSNFEKIRFYINNAVDFEEFDLFNLTLERFSLLYLCLAKENILNNVPLNIKEASIQEEEAITKKFYKDYSTFKRELFRDLVKLNMKNEVFRAELHSEDNERANKNIKHTLFKKSQKLIDRFLFIFFAEDRGLLPPNSTLEILKQWNKLKELDEVVPLYSRYKKYFNYLDTGRKGTSKTAEIFAYNGGLFKPDPILDSLIITDELLYKHTKDLSHYDFESQVDVNILGHIFENSLNEIESINAEIEGTDFDKQTTKRKKDGVFYTPKYITKYIVDNTVGKLCTEKKTELNVIEEEYFKNRKGRTKAKLKELLDNLETYREWLLHITILDPACGSGAFLNQALDFLIKEHQYIDELQTNLLGGGFIFPDIENTVLENNIFGVDLNEESVEIAKLSLWLRTAQPRRKLNNLSSNIKCGNSLIESKTVAGDKAFNWEEEFSHVFEKGGFDVVIGNPPYVHLEAIKYESEKLSKLGYSTFDKRGDLYPLFIEKGMNLLKVKGVISYIMPNKWLQAGYGRNLREYFLSKNLIQLIDFGDIQIFEGATTYPCIFIAKNDEPTSTLSVSVLKSSNSFDFETVVSITEENFETSEFSGDTWVISSINNKQLLKKINTKYITLSKYVKGDSYRGVLTGLTEAFLIDEITYQKIILEDSKAKKIIHPVLRGRDIEKWTGGETKVYLIGTFPALNIDIETYPSIKNHLLDFGKQRLEQSGIKGSRKKTSNKWFETQDAISYYTEFNKPKIMYQAFQVKPCFVYDTNNLYCNNSMWIIPTDNKALVALLNSKMGWWLITKYCTQIQNGCQLIWKYFGQIPIPELSNPNLLNRTEQMLLLKENQQSILNKFIKYLQSQFTIEKLTKKLQNWHELDFGEFIKELNKAIKTTNKERIKNELEPIQTLTKLDEMDWMEVFETKKAEAQELKAEIDQTDKEIDQLVYKLYDLTAEEIEIVENS